MHTVHLAGRPLAMFATALLLASGLTIFESSPVPAQAALPDGAEAFLVSQTDEERATGVDMTPDSQRVAFVSAAPDLVGGDENETSDVFISTAEPGSDDPFSGATALISVAIGGGTAEGLSGEPSVSADGRFVAFTSTATDLVTEAGTPDRRHVYIRDTVAGTTVRVQGSLGEPDGNSYEPDLSADGRFLVFTSDATNLVDADGDELADDDPNGFSDVFLVDRDPEEDGTFDSMRTEFVFPDDGPLPSASYEPAISGDGMTVAFTAALENLGDSSGVPLAVTGSTNVWRVHRFTSQDEADTRVQRLASHASQPALDSGGMTAAMTVEGVCGATGAMIVASILAGGRAFPIAMGTSAVRNDFGTSSNPAISSNGQTITWQSTQPRHDTQNPPTGALPASVVRVQDVPVVDAWIADRPVGDAAACGGIQQKESSDLAVGVEPSISAAGRGVAYSGPAPDSLGSTAETSAIVVDRHTNAGIDVSTTQGQLAAAGMLAALNTADISSSEIRGYASALANAPIHRIPIHRIPIHRIPIHRIPIHRIPIHRIPIHRIPIHRIPIHRIDIPGGWSELLVGTPFENQPAQSVIFGDVLNWAAAALAANSTATPAERAVAQRIQTLTLGDIELDDSAIDALTLASLVLGNAKLAEVEIAGKGSDTDRWQEAVRTQGVVATVGPETVLAELDSAGLDVGRTGIDAVALAGLPIGDMLLDTMPATSLILENTPLGDLPVSSLTAAASDALFDVPVEGTIAENASRLTATSTAADLARGVPAGVTFGDLLFSMIDRSSFPWEQIDPASIDFSPTAQTDATCTEGIDSCRTPISWQFAFDPGPGEETVFLAPRVTLELPAGTAQGYTGLQGSGPGFSRPDSEYSDGASVSDGEHVEFPFADTRGGTTYSLFVNIEVTTNPDADVTTATLTSGDLTATEQFEFGRPLEAYDDPMHNYDPQSGVWERAVPPAMQPESVYYGWISAAYRELGDDGEKVFGPAGDEDYFLIDPPAPGTRLIVSTNAADGQVAMSLYSSSPPGDSTSLGVASAGAAPGTPVTEQAPGTTNSPAESGADAGTEITGQTLVDQAAVGGSGTASVEAADLEPGGQLLLRVASGNGRRSAALYSLRVAYMEEPPEQVCPAWEVPQTTDPGIVGESDIVGPETNTVYVFDSQRFGDTHGGANAGTVRAALHGPDGKGTVGAGTVNGAVVSVDESEQVRAARATLDTNPCSMSARAALTRAINEFVSLKIGAERDHIASIVIVGGDDIVPLAPVAQHTSQFNEASHAPDLRRAKQADNSPCPSSVEIGAVDRCATPMSAAAATDYILTDDAYGLAQAYESLGGRLYVPTVAIGRLVETPQQIAATLARFVDSNGTLPADSTLTAGYGAWSELPDSVTDSLHWRSASDNDLGDSWTAPEVLGLLKPAGNGALSPRVVSLNAHADETRLLPGVPGAEKGVFTDSDLLQASSLTDAAQLAGSLVFTIGCHAGGNLPTAYYGDVPDWVDVFSRAGGYVGNTGYGLANSSATALSERLLALYADWIGVTAESGPVSSAGALTYAKQSYLGGFGMYSGYDEKALMESVYYGLPMYTFDAAATEKSMPLPEIPPGLVTTSDLGGGLTAASLSLSPLFARSTPDASGASHLIAGDDARGGQPASPSYQQPLVINGQPILPSLVYSLEARAGQTPKGALITGLTSSFDEAITEPTVAQPSVGIDQPFAPTGGGAFPSVFAQVVQQLTPTGPVDSLAVTPGRVELGVNGSGRVEKFTDMAIDVVYGSDDDDDDVAPVIRSAEMTDTSTTYRLRLTADGTGSAVTKALLLVQRQNDDGSESGEWEPFDVPVRADGSAFGVEADFDIPRGNGKPFRWFVQVVDGAGNVGIDTSRGRIEVGAAAAPELEDTGAVELMAGDRLLRTIEVTDAVPGDRLTATYAITDPEGTSDRGGPAVVELGGDGKTRVTLDELLSTSGEFTVSVQVCRGASCSEEAFPLSVGAVEVLPTITASAQSGSTAYAEGAWSRDPVTVTFTCAGGNPPLSCPTPVVVDSDTAATGILVAGTVTDAAGLSARAEFLVKLDATLPSLAPTVTPATVPIGGAAVAAANATDAGSGVATSSCDPVQTASGGTSTVECRATDAAGNTAVAAAAYTVTKAPPARCGALLDRRALPPVNADGTSVFLRGSAVPVVFRACDANGKSIGSKGFVTGVELVSTAKLPAKATVNEFLYPHLGTVYSSVAKIWQTSIPTGALARGKLYTYRVSLADGTSFTVTFGVR